MLKLGLCLFTIPTTIILLRALEIDVLANPAVKSFCLISLFGSLFCLLATYYTAELQRGRIPNSQR